VLCSKSLKNLFKDEQTDLSDIDNKASLIQQLSSLTNNWERRWAWQMGSSLGTKKLEVF
jgi:hypothetical protein